MNLSDIKDKISKAFVIDNEGKLNEVSSTLSLELHTFGVTDTHALIINCSSKFSFCRMTLDQSRTFEINATDAIEHGGKILEEQYYIPETAARELMHKGMEEEGYILFGKVKH